jgi:hypothetical protein
MLFYFPFYSSVASAGPLLMPAGWMIGTDGRVLSNT